MQKLDYKGSLKKDIRNVLVRDKKSDIIFKSTFLGMLFNIPIATLFIVLSAIDISNVEGIMESLVVITSLVDTYLFIGVPFGRIRRRKEAAKESVDKIDTLAKNIFDDLNTEAILRPTITTKEDLIESVQVESKNQDEDIITDFYSLDDENKILVLREIRRKITSKDEIQENRDELFLLDKEDLPEELPVVRRLEVVSHERN